MIHSRLLIVLSVESLNMYSYGRVFSSFWTSGSGKTLRGDPDAQLVALYLMTCPHANMIGVFHCPILYIAHEIGLPIEGATKALQRLSEGGFCTYEAPSEHIFVHRFAAFQIGEDLKPADNRVKHVRDAVLSIPSNPLKIMFLRHYSEAFHLKNLLDEALKKEKNLSPSEAPSKPASTTTTTTASTATTTATHSGALSENPTDDGKQARPASVISTAARKSRATVAPSREAWEAYAAAYQARYGADPVRNATVNGQLANFVKRIGQDEAPQVAAFYVGHAGRMYVQAMHPLNLLVRDAEKLRTEWATGRIQTETKARNTDRLAEQGAVWDRLIQANEAQGGH